MIVSKGGQAMIKVKDIDSLLSGVAPKELSESWDNDGVMLCKTSEKEVKKILVMLEVTSKGIDFAVKNGFDLIVTHHPFIFKPLSKIDGLNYEMIEKLIKSEISVLSYHTRLDSAENGVNTCNAQLLELDNVKGFGGESGNIGRIGNLPKPMTPEQFALYLNEKFACGNVRASVFKTQGKLINTVAVIGGAGKSFFYDAYAAGADAFVTGEASHNTFIDCFDLDMCLFECGHYYTENKVCEHLKKIIDSSFVKEVYTEVFDVQSPYVNL